MKSESIVFGVAGTFFGLIAGWLIGSQQAVVRPAAPPAQAAAAPTGSGGGGAPAAPRLDEQEARRLEDIARSDPANATPRAQLGNLYFDAEKYDLAIKWYEEALKLDPTNPDVSTDLGVSYYYSNQPDRALAQFTRSLEIEPKHTKTMLNQGIVLAFGKQDLDGASKAWQRVVELAPNTPEGQAARRALESMKSAHPDLNTASPGTN
ncbi:MAG TPA: tetratricopeptide repeat protein [Vicinamibacterales bacterium]|nr:tetratricopeptide repeat protein [Vicinamibacterales bacterium]